MDGQAPSKTAPSTSIRWINPRPSSPGRGARCCPRYGKTVSPVSASVTVIASEGHALAASRMSSSGPSPITIAVSSRPKTSGAMSTQSPWALQPRGRWSGCISFVRLLGSCCRCSWWASSISRRSAISARGLVNGQGRDRALVARVDGPEARGRRGRTRSGRRRRARRGRRMDPKAVLVAPEARQRRGPGSSPEHRLGGRDALASGGVPVLGARVDAESRVE